MSSRHYHTPPPTLTTRLQCPVCHKSVYSRAGIHPQCAVRLDDPPRPKPINKRLDPAAPLDHMAEVAESAGIEPVAV